MQRLPVTLADLFPPLAPGGDQYTGTRTPGLHVSAVVYSLTQKALGLPAPLGIGLAEADRALNGYMLAGLALEEQLGDRLADQYSRLYAPHAFRPGEWVRDGIIGTPDLIDPRARWLDGTEGECVEEWKLTTKSSRDADPGANPKFLYYWWQGKTYCALRGIPTLRIRVLHLCGDWLFDRSPEPGPHFRCWEETFTARELEEHWALIRAEAERMRRGR